MGAERSRATRAKARRRRYGWTRPRWRDGHFWLAVVIAAALIALQVAVNARASWVDWVGLGLRAIVTWVIVSTILRIRRAMPTALVEGYVEAEEQAKARPSGQSTGESIARTSGRTVGRALGAYKRASGKD